MANGQSPRRTSLVLPIVLVTIGAMFLYANWRPAFDPWPILRTYWPLILVFVGLGKMWDATRARQNPGGTARSGVSLGATFGILAFVLVLVILFWHGRAFSHGRHYSSDAQHQSRTVDRHGAKHNQWNLRFSNDVPLELKVEIGAGRGNLRLRDLPVTHLEMSMGAGQADVDLTGDRKNDLEANLEGGVGQVTIRLPRKVGVVVRASGGIGAVDAHGLRPEDGEYTHETYGKTPATIRLTVHGGVGQISLIEEP